MCYNWFMAQYEVIGTDENGREIRRYEDGSIRDNKGRMVVKLDSPAPLLNPELVRQYRQARKERILEAVEKGLTDVTRTRLPEEAISAIVKKRAKIALTDNGKAGNDAARIVLQVIDAYQNKGEETTHTTRHEYALDDETKALLETMLERRRRGTTDREE